MKKVCLLLVLCLAVNIIKAQTRAEKIAIKACEYLEDINDYTVMQDSIKPYLIKANSAIETTDDAPYTVEGIRKLYAEAFNALIDKCDYVRDSYTQMETKKYYKMSDSEKANTLYEEGNDYKDAGAYDKAIKKYLKAIKIDTAFIYALDHLAICYRKLDDYDNALKYYNEALVIFPKGEIALLNSAVVYSLQKNYSKAAMEYEKLKYWHPYNPEGYFGLARMQIIQGDVDGCLDNLLIAHVIYTNTGNEYVSDSLKLLKAVYADMEARGKENLFFEKANEYNINIATN